MSFELRNFRAFRDARIDLEPGVTVLLGRNDTGKSSLLDAISSHGASLGGPRGPQPKPVWSVGSSASTFSARWQRAGEVWQHSIRLDLRDPDERLSFGPSWWHWDLKTQTLRTHAGSFTLNDPKTKGLRLTERTAEQWLRDTDVPEPVFAPLLTAASFSASGPYLFEPTQLRQQAINTTQPPELTGRGWPLWLQQIFNRRDGDLDEIEAALRSMFPFFRGIRLQLGPTPDTDADPSPRADRLGYSVSIEVGAGEDSARPLVLPVRAASTGLLLALAHLTLVYADDSADLLLIEEPENGLNAKITLDMMRSFLDAVRRRDRQVVLTTHNPWWLDLVPRESIRVVTRDKDGAHIQRPNVEELDALLAETDAYPSELMGMYGPEGLLMKRRPRNDG